MATLEQRIKFAKKNVTAKSGKHWGVKGRDWVVDEFWRPATGFKLWPRVPGSLCSKCSELVGDIVEHQNDTPPKCRRKTMSGDGSCKGVTAEPIILTVLCLPRRSGKTFNTAAWVLSQLFQERRKRIGFIASSEDQMLALFNENYGEVIERSPALSKHAEVRISKGTIKVARTGSSFEGMSTSHSGATGRGRTMIVIDEAIDVPARVASAILPSIFESSGMECPNGHIQTSAGEKAPKNCPACKEPLRNWYGRILITSSAGMIDGVAEKDWFSELVTHLRANPSPNVHLYEATTKQNPDISDTITNAVSDVFGSLDSTRQYMFAQVDNRFTRKGDSLLSKAEIDQCVDNGLRNKMKSERECVAFLDTSRTVDKTSLVVLAWDEELSTDRWSHLMVERIDVWDPKELPGGVVNPAAILDHLDLYLPLFPNLRAIRVDTRVMPWAVALVQKCKKERPWGSRIDGWHGKKAERQSAWTLLHQRLMARTIRIPPHKELREELLSVRRVQDISGNLDIKDANRNIRHVDIAESLATACLLAHMEGLTRRQGLAELSESAAAPILAKLYRPYTSKIDLSSF